MKYLFLSLSLTLFTSCKFLKEDNPELFWGIQLGKSIAFNSEQIQSLFKSGVIQLSIEERPTYYMSFKTSKGISYYASIILLAQRGDSIVSSFKVVYFPNNEYFKGGIENSKNNIIDLSIPYANIEDIEKDITTNLTKKYGKPNPELSSSYNHDLWKYKNIYWEVNKDIKIDLQVCQPLVVTEGSIFGNMGSITLTYTLNDYQQKSIY